MNGFEDDPMGSAIDGADEEFLRMYVDAAQRRHFSDIERVAGFEVVDDPNPATLSPGRVIQISRAIVRCPKICKLLILHELIHHKLWVTTGNAHREEGLNFQREVERLWSEGAYKGIL